MQRYYEESSRRKPVVAETDVLVAVAGPAGVGETLAAAWTGVRVMLLEKYKSLGGMATSGMMSHWSGAKEYPLGNEVVDRMSKIASLPLEFKENISEFDTKWGIAQKAQK